MNAMLLRLFIWFTYPCPMMLGHWYGTQTHHFRLEYLDVSNSWTHVLVSDISTRVQVTQHERIEQISFSDCPHEFFRCELSCTLLKKKIRQLTVRWVYRTLIFLIDHIDFDYYCLIKEFNGTYIHINHFLFKFSILVDFISFLLDMICFIIGYSS